MGGGHASGGGTSGSVSWPGHMVAAFHGDGDYDAGPSTYKNYSPFLHGIDHWMFNRVTAPYGVHTFYYDVAPPGPGPEDITVVSPFADTDPILNVPYQLDITDDITAIDKRLKDFDAEVEQYDALTDGKLQYQAAADYIDKQDVPDEDYLNMVRAEEKVARQDHLRAISTFKAQMAEQNATRTSSFIVGLALLEGDYLNKVSEMGDKVVSAIHKQRLDMIPKLASQMSKLLFSKIYLKQVSMATYVDTKRVELGVEKEKLDRALGMNVKAHLWDAEIYQHGYNLLAAAQGSVVTTTKGRKDSSSGCSLLSGLLVGIGAFSGMGGFGALGSVFGGGGTTAQIGGQ